MLVSVPYFIIAENFIYGHMIRLLKVSEFAWLHKCLLGEHNNIVLHFLVLKYMVYSTSIISCSSNSHYQLLIDVWYSVFHIPFKFVYFYHLVVF